MDDLFLVFQIFGEFIYFDMIYTYTQVHRFKIIIKPDLGDASLSSHDINISAILSNDVRKSLDEGRVCEGLGYMICWYILVYMICPFHRRRHAMEWTLPYAQHPVDLHILPKTQVAVYPA